MPEPPKIDVMKILEPENDRWVVLCPGKPHQIKDTEEEANVVKKLLLKEIPDAEIEVKRLVSFRVKLPGMSVLVDPDRVDDRFLLVRTVLQRLQMLSAQLMAGVRGDAPVITVAKPGDVPPETGGPPKLRAVKR